MKAPCNIFGGRDRNICYLNCQDHFTVYSYVKNHSILHLKYAYFICQLNLNKHKKESNYFSLDFLIITNDIEHISSVLDI